MLRRCVSLNVIRKYKCKYNLLSCSVVNNNKYIVNNNNKLWFHSYNYLNKENNNNNNNNNIDKSDEDKKDEEIDGKQVEETVKNEYKIGQNYISSIGEIIELAEVNGKLYVKKGDQISNETPDNYIKRQKIKSRGLIFVVMGSVLMILYGLYSHYRARRVNKEDMKLRQMISEQLGDDMKEFRERLKSSKEGNIDEEAFTNLLMTTIDNKRINSKLSEHDSWLIEYIMSCQSTKFSNDMRLVMAKWLAWYMDAYRNLGPVDTNTILLRYAFEIEVANKQLELLDINNIDDKITMKNIRCMQWDAALKSYNTSYLNKILDEFIQLEQFSKDEYSRILKGAPMLGRWSVFRDVYNKLMHTLSENSRNKIRNVWSYNPIKNPNEPDYNLLYESCENLSDVTIDNVKWHVYNINGLYMSFNNVQCNDDEICNKLKREHSPGNYHRKAQDGRTWLENNLVGISQARILRWGAIAQMQNPVTSIPIILWGPIINDQLYLVGQAPLRDEISGQIVLQREEWFLKKEKETDFWVGKYRSTQSDLNSIKNENEKYNSNDDSRHVTLEYDIITKLELQESI